MNNSGTKIRNGTCLLQEKEGKNHNASDKINTFIVSFSIHQNSWLFFCKDN
jgi:hypothetical protein